jgi:hypothetical protein
MGHLLEEGGKNDVMVYLLLLVPEGVDGGYRAEQIARPLISPSSITAEIVRDQPELVAGGKAPVEVPSLV